MNIAAVCCTYLRPERLGHLVRCFELQDYPAERRELLILDDAGQYGNREGPGWRLVSVARRFATLGEKRNAAADLVSERAEALAVWDDDDLYLPWALSASVAALRAADWSLPSIVLHPDAGGALKQHRTGGLFHGGWAYRRAVFHRAGGYPTMNNGEDQGLGRRLRRAGAVVADPCELGFQPFYVYAWGGGWHLSGMGREGYRRLGERTVEKTSLRVADPPRIALACPRILPTVHPRVF